MIVKIIGIGGDMASGKSYLVRTLLGLHRTRAIFRSVTVEFTRLTNVTLLAIGKYDQSRYPGTDFMYHPNLETDVLACLNLINTNKTIGERVGVIFEGDRLFKNKFINMIKDVFPIKLIMLQVTQDVIFKRHMLRCDNQQMKQIMLKEKRNRNLLKSNPLISPMDNNTPEDFNNITSFILSEIGEL